MQSRFGVLPTVSALCFPLARGHPTPISAVMSAASHSRYHLLCHAADMSAVLLRRKVCCVTQQTCQLYNTADMSAMSHSRHFCCVTQQSCLQFHKADMSAVSHGRHVCCVIQQTCLLCHTGDFVCCVCCVAPGRIYAQRAGWGSTGLTHRDLDRPRNYNA